MVEFGNLGYCIGTSEKCFFSETIAASDLKVSRSRHLIECLKKSIEGQGHFLTLAQGRVHTKI